MKLGSALVVFAAVAGFATSALAAEVAPDAVEFADGGVKASLTGAPGDPANGAKAFANRGLGNCLACHANKDMEKELFHGNVGPVLDGVASRYSAEELRAIVVNAKKVFSDETVMPGFYSLEVGKNVDEKFAGKTILSAQDVEDVVAYLATLKE